MTGRLSDLLLKMVLMAGAFASATLLLRDGMALGLRVPLDPNEGWNAYHTLAAMTGGALYPHGFMVNNYPPLSFYIVGLLGKSLGDFIIAGRLVALVAFLAVAMGLMALLRQLGGEVLHGIFAGLLFAAGLLIASDYVAMDDPQLLGHALQIEALLLLLRQKPAVFPAALLLAAGLFVKQNLIALPLAALIWLCWENWRQALFLALYGLGFCAAGLAAIHIGLGVNLFAELAAPRIWSMANATAALTHYLSWAGLPLLLTALLGWYGRRDAWMRFAAMYAAIALALGAGFSAGDGVDANIFFDLDIAMALTAGLAFSRVPQRWHGLLALAYAAPLALFLAENFHDGNFGYTEGFQRQAPADISLVAIARGPALCEQLSLCYWAAKPAAVDVFNMSEQFQTGARRPEGLAQLIKSRQFGVIQVDSLNPFSLGPKVRQALEAAYRVHHIDDNGVFLVPR
jgi:hypothetical protein